MSKTQTKQMLINKITELENALKEREEWTGLYDTLGNKIFLGNIVHWTDGGDELSLGERILTRGDRIAKVIKKHNCEICFIVIDSPHPKVKDSGMDFNFGSFIYTNTRKYLTVVASNIDDYKSRFKNAGECMKWVLDARKDKS